MQVYDELLCLLVLLVYAHSILIDVYRARGDLREF